MPDLRVVLGPLSAIEDAFAETMIAARSADPLAPVTVLVGQTLVKRYLPRMLAQRGIAHINVRFVLADELALQLAPRGAVRTRTSPNAERLLVRFAVQAAGSYFGEIARGDGFTDALRRLFRELERGSFSPESLVAANAAAGLAGDKVDDLSRMYAAFQRRRLDAGLVGSTEIFASAEPSSLKGPLLVYGLWSPAAAQASLIEQIAAIRDCIVFLPEVGLDADDAHAALRVRLSALDARIERVTDEPTDATTQLARRVFRTPQVPIGSEAIALVSAPDTVREVWEAARACLAWAQEGIGFHEMAVIYRNREPYRALVDEIFREVKVPTYLHDGRLLSTHPLGRRLLLLLELLADATFSRQRVMEFLTETHIPASMLERYPRLRPSEWEAFTREAGVVAGIDQWLMRLQRLASEKRARAANERFSWLASHADRVLQLRAFAEELHERISLHPETATWQDHLAFVRKIAAAYADGLEPLLKALDELAGLSQVAAEVPFSTFLATVRDDLDSRDVTDVLGDPVREFGKHGVTVVDASSLRHMRFRAVYMLGMAERAWPPPKRPDPLLLEHERKAINAAAPADQRLPLRTSPDEETLTFIMAIEAARERLTISYARAEAGGSGSHLPSYFFRAAAQAIEGRELSVADVEQAASVRRLASGRLSVADVGASISPAEYDRGLIRAIITGTQPGVIDALAACDAADPRRTGGAIRRAVEARRQRWGGELTAYDGTMRSGPALARAAALNFGRDQAVSPSRLEKYAHCPYQYFLRYGLGIEDSDEPENLDRIDQLERGSLIHAILERFLKQVGRSDPPATDAREGHLTMLLEIAASEAQEREERGVTGRPLIWALDRRQIFEDLVRWYDEEVVSGAYTSFRPGAYEVGFGGVTFGYGGSDDPLTTDEPLILQVGGRELRLQGRIDRVDWDDAKTQFRVIDYKTGRSGGKAAFDKGRSLQLPLYMHAAASALGIPVEDGEAQYFYCTSKGGFKRSEITGVELAGRADEMEQVLTTIVDGVDSGFFAPNPGKGAFNCRWCEYTNICDSRIEHIVARKADDPRATTFIALQEIK